MPNQASQKIVRHDVSGFVDPPLPHVLSDRSRRDVYAFKLLCAGRQCRRVDEVRVREREIGDERRKQEATELFAARGWVVSGGVPRCPSCARAIEACRPPH